MYKDTLMEDLEALRNDSVRAEYGHWIARYDAGLVLNQARKSQGLTQEDVARLGQVSQAYISKLESGEANPTIGKLGSLLAAIWLRLRIDYGPLVPQGEGITIPYTTQVVGEEVISRRAVTVAASVA